MGASVLLMITPNLGLSLPFVSVEGMGLQPRASPFAERTAGGGPQRSQQE